MSYFPEPYSHNNTTKSDLKSATDIDKSFVNPFVAISLTSTVISFV